MVADAVAVEPVSASKFPANREINREFLGIDPLDTVWVADTSANSEGCGKIPYTTEQGIILKKQGFWTAPQGVNREFESRIADIEIQREFSYPVRKRHPEITPHC